MSVVPERRHRRRARVLVGAMASAALLLTACGDGDDDAGSTADGDAGGATADDAAFPVEITDALGTTVIEEEPERVVTLGWGQDIVYSLGVLPVGVERDDYAGDAEGFAPWYRDALDADGAELPQAIQMYPELDIDAVVELEPDLVLAPHSGLEQDVYDQLSQFTDVVAYPDEPWHTEWREQIEISAAALGREDRGTELIAEVEGTLADAAADHPEFAEADFAYIYAGNQLNSLHIYPDFDARVAFLNELGMSMDPAIADLEADDNFFTASIGLENADMLDDVDVLLTWFNDEAEQQQTEAQGAYAQIPAFARGSYVALLEPQIATATSTITPLSVPWALDRYLPMISDAIAKVDAGS